MRLRDAKRFARTLTTVAGCLLAIAAGFAFLRYAFADPSLELHDGNGALLAANNDWQDDPAQAAQLTAAGLAPTNPLESGIVATLSPGPYTGIVLGTGGTTGTAVVEVYDLN
jgi:hypothetical protein